MKGDTTGELWGQVRSLQNEVTMIRTRQDIAIERVKEYVEECHHNNECSTLQLGECKTLLQEILVTQQTYNKIASRVLPFVIVLFTAAVSIVTSWLLARI